MSATIIDFPQPVRRPEPAPTRPPTEEEALLATTLADRMVKLLRRALNDEEKQ